uniref:Uncharacterized protein n=1 Tax=Strix occidentalis caurina TaxID=311401 RepID=A0A8D0EIH5_STROC
MSQICRDDVRVLLSTWRQKRDEFYPGNLQTYRKPADLHPAVAPSHDMVIKLCDCLLHFPFGTRLEICVQRYPTAFSMNLWVFGEGDTTKCLPCNPPAPKKGLREIYCTNTGHHVQQAGDHMALVYNVDSEQLITMMADDKEIQQLIKIPSLFTGQSVSSTLLVKGRAQKSQVKTVPHVLQPAGTIP